MPLRHSEYERAEGDFYVEPAWVLPPLIQRLELTQFHDPCCGLGTLVTTALQHGVAATGADIADRAFGLFPVRDFLADTATYPSVVTNPPYNLAEKIIGHGIDHVVEGGHVAVLVPLTFLASCRRYGLFTRQEMALAMILSKRPSMPPGDALLEHGEKIRGSGATDFAWVVWQRGRTAGASSIEWMRP